MRVRRSAVYASRGLAGPVGAASLPSGALWDRSPAGAQLPGPPGQPRARLAAASSEGGPHADRRDTGPGHLPCSTSPMVVPEAAVDIVAGAVVCLPTASTGLETRGGRTQTGGQVRGERDKGSRRRLELRPRGRWLQSPSYTRARTGRGPCASFLPEAPAVRADRTRRGCWAGSRAPQTERHTHNEDGSQTPAQVPRTNHRTEQAAGPTRVALSLRGYPGPWPQRHQGPPPRAASGPSSAHPSDRGRRPPACPELSREALGPPATSPTRLSGQRQATQVLANGWTDTRGCGWAAGGTDTGCRAGTQRPTRTDRARAGGRGRGRGRGRGPACRTPALSEGLRERGGRGAGAGHSEAPWRRPCSPEKLRVASMVVRMAPWGETHSWGCLQARGPRQAAAAAPREPPPPGPEQPPALGPTLPTNHCLQMRQGPGGSPPTRRAGELHLGGRGRERLAGPALRPARGTLGVLLGGTESTSHVRLGRAAPGRRGQRWGPCLTLSFLRALNFFRHSTVSCLCIMEATVERCCGQRGSYASRGAPALSPREA